MLNMSCSERQAINDCKANDHESNEMIKHRAQRLKTNHESRRQYVNERFCYSPHFQHLEVMLGFDKTSKNKCCN